MKSMAWLSVIYGTTGFTYFCHGGDEIGTFTARWCIDNAGMNAAITAQNTLLLSMAPVINAPDLQRSWTVPISWIKRRHLVNGDTYWIAGNMTADTLTDAELNFAVADAATLNVIDEARNEISDRGTITDTFDPYEVHIYRLVP
jgi:hypothetical protein